MTLIQSLAQNEFDSNLVLSCETGQKCFADGAAVIAAFSLGTPSIWINVLINLGLAGVFFICGYCFFVRSSAPLHKLK
jgi:hypothetical protein